MTAADRFPAFGPPEWLVELAIVILMVGIVLAAWKGCRA